MIALEGYYNEEYLHRLLYDGQISRLEYIYHHSEERKTAFLDYCHKRGLPVTEASAEQFMQHELEEEEREMQSAESD